MAARTINLCSYQDVNFQPWQFYVDLSFFGGKKVTIIMNQCAFTFFGFMHRCYFVKHQDETRCMKICLLSLSEERSKQACAARSCGKPLITLLVRNEIHLDCPTWWSTSNTTVLIHLYGHCWDSAHTAHTQKTFLVLHTAVPAWLWDAKIIIIIIREKKPKKHNSWSTNHDVLETLVFFVCFSRVGEYT